MSESYNVGDVVGRLTITSLQPLTCKCECGTVVDHYRPWNFRNGVKSCGCLHRGPNPTASWWARANYIPIKCVNPLEKNDARVWRVQCSFCGKEHVKKESSCRKAAFKPERSGCSKCYRSAKR